jgi:hypothetical protein
MSVSCGRWNLLILNKSTKGWEKRMWGEGGGSGLSKSLEFRHTIFKIILLNFPYL